MLRFPCIHSDIPRGNKQGERNEVISYSFFPFAWVKGFFLSTSGKHTLMHSSQKGWQAGCSENQLHIFMETGNRERNHGRIWTSNLPLFWLPCLHFLLQFLVCLPSDSLPEACADRRSSSRALCASCLYRRACLSAARLAVFKKWSYSMINSAIARHSERPNCTTDLVG